MRKLSPLYLFNWSIPLDVTCLESSSVWLPFFCHSSDSAFWAAHPRGQPLTPLGLSHLISPLCGDALLILLGLWYPSPCLPSPSHLVSHTPHQATPNMDTFFSLLEFCHPAPGECSSEMLFLSYSGSNSSHWATPPRGLLSYPAQDLTLYASFPFFLCIGCPPYSNGLWLHTQATPSVCRDALFTLLGLWHPMPYCGLSSPCWSSWPQPPLLIHTYLGCLLCSSPPNRFRNEFFREGRERLWNTFNIDKKELRHVYKLMIYHFF